jgi:hypothetical protein
LTPTVRMTSRKFQLGSGLLAVSRWRPKEWTQIRWVLKRPYSYGKTNVTHWIALSCILKYLRNYTINLAGMHYVMELFLPLPGGCVSDGSSIKPIQTHSSHLRGDTPIFLRPYYFAALDRIGKEMSFYSGRTYENALMP